jgi:NAD-dependent deacetylase
MKKIVVLSGAGISAESGVPTFRDANGLWHGHDVMEVATPEGWEANPELVLEFYNQRRRGLKTVVPNPAHLALAEAEQYFEVEIVTQNVDDLHERAGSTRVLHLHGELLKVRSTGNELYVQTWQEDLLLGDCCPDGFQLRPHIVWFGEMVPLLEVAIERVALADALMVVGSSMQVYPAASLVHYARPETPVFYIDPKPASVHRQHLQVIPEAASTGVAKALNLLNDLLH